MNEKVPCSGLRLVDLPPDELAALALSGAAPAVHACLSGRSDVMPCCHTNTGDTALADRVSPDGLSVACGVIAL